jgi:MOSC domain-containing protein YiiM
MRRGRVEGIYVGEDRGAELDPVNRVRAVPGQGLEGDRYFHGRGEFYALGKDGQDLTLIEAEAIEGLAVDTGIELAPAEARRNVVTRGISLNDLVGKRFSIGAVECLGRRLCEPCRYLERSTHPGVLAGLSNRGGLRADVVSGGWIEVGAPVVELG